MAMGRPTLYTPELAERICHAIATSPLGLKRICDENPDLPSHQTVKNWRIERDDFFALYLVAKEKQAFEIAEFVWDMALEVDERPEAAAKYVNIFRTAQWQTSRLSSKQFGDKKQVTQEMNINVHERDLQDLK